jgi:imidazolonepropionase-like amidohydrolase
MTKSIMLVVVAVGVTGIIGAAGGTGAGATGAGLPVSLAPVSLAPVPPDSSVPPVPVPPAAPVSPAPVPLAAPVPPVTPARASYIYAIQGARIVPVSGPVIDSGTIVFRDGVITVVGANVSVPAGAQLIAGKGLTVYHGLIDMGSTTGLDLPPVPRADNPRTTEDVERVKADYLLRAQFRAADYVSPTSAALARAAAAGITSILATPPGDAIRGQSALINTALGDDEPQIGAVADERKGAMVIRTPVALHVTFSEQPAGGAAYPNSLMGVVAFVRQAFLDAQYWGTAHTATRTTFRPFYEPAFEAMQPALAGRLPVAFEGQTSREILRGLDMARAFKLDPIITNARESDLVSADLKAANARVILSVNYPTRPQNLAPDADEPLQTLRGRVNAPKTAAALAKAGVPFAFASAGLEEPRDFIKNAAKAVQNGLSRDAAIRALTAQAATIAGAGDRLGSLDTGKIANLLVTEGDLFDEKMTLKHVFVDGRRVNIEVAPPPTNRRGQ